MFTIVRNNAKNDYDNSTKDSGKNLFDVIYNSKTDERMLDTLLNIDNLNGENVSNDKKGQRFEWFLYDLFKHAGYDVEKNSKEGMDDDKIDLIVQKGNEKIAIQAKNYKLDGTGMVNKDVAMSLSGAIENRQDITAGAVITTSFFTYPAKEWQAQIKGKPVYLIDREKLLVLISELYPQLLAKAYFEQETKQIHRCKLCGNITVKKWSESNKNYFRSCVNYPKCGYTESIQTSNYKKQDGYQKNYRGSNRYSSKYKK